MPIRARTRRYYQFRIIYKSGADFDYAYEVNISEEQATDILDQIEKRVPRITFDGRTIFPKRIKERRIFSTETPFTHSSQRLRELFPKGYNEDFGGREVTREILTNLQIRERERVIESQEERQVITETRRREFPFIQILSVVVTIIVAIGGIYGYAYHNRPIVDYMLGCNYEVGESVNLRESEIKIQIKIKNRGNMDCPMNLIVTLRNATFQNIKTETYRRLINEDRILIYNKRNQKGRVNWWIYNTSIMPDQNVSKFDVTYELEHTSGGHFINDILKRTAEIIPYDPTYIAFKQKEPRIYKRID